MYCYSTFVTDIAKAFPTCRANARSRSVSDRIHWSGRMSVHVVVHALGIVADWQAMWYCGDKNVPCYMYIYIYITAYLLTSYLAAGGYLTCCMC